MGGIFGYVGDVRGDSSDILKRMVSAMNHRGQKSKDFISVQAFNGGIVAYPWESGTSVVSSYDHGVTALCEGEIYNPKELALNFGNDIGPKTVNGFDLVPHLYSKYGQDFARKMNGVFAIALWDSRKGELLLARDHLGSHSIFYVQTKEGLYFASTIKSLFSTGFADREIDPASLDRYFASLAISPPYSMFKNIKAVRPGYILAARGSRLQEHDFFRLWEVTEDFEKTEDHFSAELRDIFEDAVKIRADYGGKIGALVSGGVDTGAVTEVLAKTIDPKELTGFSIAFDEKDFSDASLQNIIYARLGLERRQMILRPKEFGDTLIDCTKFLDNPVNDVASAGMLHALRIAADSGCTAVFEGEGSDEIFCTSHSMGELGIQRFLSLPFTVRKFFFGSFKHWFSGSNNLPAKVIRLLARIGMSDLERRCTWIPGFPWQIRKQLLGREHSFGQTWEAAEQYYQESGLKDNINKYQYGLSKLFLPDDLLYKNERMASAAGVVNRTPFIDYRLVKKAFEIPARFKIRTPTKTDDGTKLIFKRAMRGVVPDEILDRKKSRGFSQPTTLWYREDLKEFVHDNLFARDARVL